MFVSFIVATYNCEPEVPRFLRGLDQLKFDDYEVLITDGGSTDATVDKLSIDPRIKIIKAQRDNGIYDAWNYALEFSCGDYISFLGIDDQPLGEFLCLSKRHCDTSKINPGLIYGNAITKRKNKFRRRTTPDRLEFFSKNGIILDFVHPGSLNNRKLFDGSRFDNSFTLAGDLDFYLGIKSMIQSMGIVKIPLDQAVVGGDGVSNSSEAYAIYHREFLAIGQKRSINFNPVLPRYKIGTIFRYIPTIFSLLRDLSWSIRSTSDRAKI